MKKEARIYTGGKTSSSINSVGKTEWLCAKEQTGLLSHSKYKIQKQPKGPPRDEQINKIWDVYIYIYMYTHTHTHTHTHI